MSFLPKEGSYKEFENFIETQKEIEILNYRIETLQKENDKLHNLLNLILNTGNNS